MTIAAGDVGEIVEMLVDGVSVFVYVSCWMERRKGKNVQLMVRGVAIRMQRTGQLNDVGHQQYMFTKVWRIAYDGRTVSKGLSRQRT